MFQLYYKLQRIVERWEWEDFMSALHQPLPVTFRFARDVSASFRSEGNQLLTAWARRHPRTRELRVVDGWQLHLDKHELRAAEGGSEEAALHRWLVRGSESGMLVRQEVASMLPAVLLDVPADAIVLDMCASPGSKTTQVLEKLGDNGLVVANDSSPLRCNTLARRTGSLGHRSSSLVVTCHPAQAMPRLRDDGFTRIVCDVPCTGDGTTRKHPEVMQRWEVALALRHHPLQLQIALRGASLLQVPCVHVSSSPVTHTPSPHYAHTYTHDHKQQLQSQNNTSAASPCSPISHTQALRRASHALCLSSLAGLMC